MIDCFLRDASGVLSCQFRVLLCIVVLGCMQIPELFRGVRGVSFLTENALERDIAHRKSVAVLCMLYKIKCNQMLPLYGVLPVPYLPVWVTRGALVTHRILMRLFAAEPRNTA